ncbi:MAG: magnesium transporter CorA family protein, partial [Rhodospirillales bacterium]|nr:magnesium transporter CorA family protein [Rhodospirillales bacterium]
IPTREEMQEIEASSRLYREDDALYMTAPVVIHADTASPETTAVTFILSRACAVTVRYATPQPFITFSVRATRQRGLALSADAVLAGLLEAVIDRLADVLERIGGDLDSISHEVFETSVVAQVAKAGRQGRGAGPDYQVILRNIGRNGNLASKTRESILGIGRILIFMSQAGDTLLRKDCKHRFKTMDRDIRSLTEHVAFLSGKINFLLDATLGMINIQQNNIIKIFSVMAVVFLPPTLIASIYGMNFQFQPELHWELGYPYALLLMVLSAVLPYFYFKQRGWL